MAGDQSESVVASYQDILDVPIPSDLGPWEERTLSLVKEGSIQVSGCGACHAEGSFVCGVCEGRTWTACAPAEPCWTCSGNGYVTETRGNRTRRLRCMACDGGFVTCSKCAGTGRVNCVNCAGHGRIHCGECDGTAKVTTLTQGSLVISRNAEDLALDSGASGITLEQALDCGVADQQDFSGESVPAGVPPAEVEPLARFLASERPGELRRRLMTIVCPAVRMEQPREASFGTIWIVGTKHRVNVKKSLSRKRVAAFAIIASLLAAAGIAMAADASIETNGEYAKLVAAAKAALRSDLVGSRSGADSDTNTNTNTKGWFRLRVAGNKLEGFAVFKWPGGHGRKVVRCSYNLTEVDNPDVGNPDFPEINVRATPREAFSYCRPYSRDDLPKTFSRSSGESSIWLSHAPAADGPDAWNPAMELVRAS